MSSVDSPPPNKNSHWVHLMYSGMLVLALFMCCLGVVGGVTSEIHIARINAAGTMVLCILVAMVYMQLRDREKPTD